MKNKIENFDDIIFEKRNKEYGAYELRKRYSKRGSVALAVSIIVLLVGVGIPLIASIINRVDYDRYIEGGSTIELITDIPKNEVVVPPPPPPPTTDVKAVKFEVPKIVDSTSIDAGDVLTTGEYGDFANKVISDTTVEKIVIVNEIETSYVEKKPLETWEITEQPTLEGLTTFISENIRYPQEAIDNDIQGTVYVKFVVKSTGAVEDVQLLRGVNDLLDNEALRIVSILPKWNPGKQNGTPVSVRFTIPIKFKLQD